LPSRKPINLRKIPGIPPNLAQKDGQRQANRRPAEQGLSGTIGQFFAGFFKAT
jgi:hypothetical protein